MKQKRFVSDYVDTLKKSVSANLSIYKNEDEFPLDDSKFELMPEIDHPESLVDKLLENENLKLEAIEKDYRNALLIYRNYQKLSPLLASHEEFWSYLCHKDLFHYVKKRRNKVFEYDDSKTISLIKKHWFGASRNTVGRLWWSVFLSIDTEKRGEAKFDLTKILFIQSDILQNLSFSDALFPNRIAVHAILEFYKDHPEILELKGARNERNRLITQSLNRWGGMKNLSYFNKDDFRKELERNLDTILSIGPDDNHNDFEWIQS